MPPPLTTTTTTTWQVYTRELARLVLPVSEQVFGDAEMAARRAALRSFETQLLGRSQGAALGEQLNKAMTRERDIKATANVAQSNMVCQVSGCAGAICDVHAVFVLRGAVLLALMAGGSVCCS